MQQLVDTFFSAAKDKDVTALDALFTADAVYVERNGETYNGLPQIKEWFNKLITDGDVRAWDIRKIRDYNSQRHSQMSRAEVIADIKKGANEVIQKYGLKIQYAKTIR